MVCFFSTCLTCLSIMYMFHWISIILHLLGSSSWFLEWWNYITLLLGDLFVHSVENFIIPRDFNPVGGLEHEFDLSIQLGILIPTDFHSYFFRGVGFNHQPAVIFFIGLGSLVSHHATKNWRPGCQVMIPSPHPRRRNQVEWNRWLIRVTQRSGYRAIILFNIF